MMIDKGAKQTSAQHKLGLCKQLSNAEYEKNMFEQTYS